MLGEGFWGGSVTRKRELSDIRRQACLQRADRQGGAGDNAVETPDDDIDKEFSVDEEDEEDSAAGQQVKSSLSTMKRRKADLVAMFPDNIVLQREVLKLLVQDFEHKNILIDQQKVPARLLPALWHSSRGPLDVLCPAVGGEGPSWIF